MKNMFKSLWTRLKVDRDFVDSLLLMIFGVTIIVAAILTQSNIIVDCVIGGLFFASGLVRLIIK